jgi:hypothetical protein
MVRMIIKITETAKSILIVESYQTFLILSGEVIDLKFVDIKGSSSSVKKVSSL